jgi:hypothetical protein
VVVEFAGTTTVVLAGGSGLLLLMQPDNKPAVTKSADTIFIIYSSTKWAMAHLGGHFACATDADFPRPHEAIAIAHVVQGPTRA